MNNINIGKYGEEIATKFLEQNGFEIIERNKHFSKFCEIDIIAKLKDKVIFIEVKTRRNNNYGAPLEAITKSKYNNIKLGVFSYITEKNIKKYQIDAISILLEPDLKINHLKNI